MYQNLAVISVMAYQASAGGVRSNGHKNLSRDEMKQPRRVIKAVCRCLRQIQFNSIDPWDLFHKYYFFVNYGQMVLIPRMQNFTENEPSGQSGFGILS